MSSRSRRVLQAAERERLAELGADDAVLRELEELLATAGPDSTVGRVFAVASTRVSLATAAGVADAGWAVDSLPAVGDWVVVAGDEVVAQVPDEPAAPAEVDRSALAADHERRRDDPVARKQHKQQWMAREADGDSRARP